MNFKKLFINGLLLSSGFGGPRPGAACPPVFIADKDFLKKLPPSNMTGINTNYKTLVSNNCYDYATGWMTDSFLPPGAKGGDFDDTRYCSCEGFGRKLKADGLKHISGRKVPKENNIIGAVAAVIKNSTTRFSMCCFHFYKLCNDGKWYHKYGWKPVRDTHENGRPIFDVAKTFIHDGFNQFCGYFAIFDKANIKNKCTRHC